MPLPQTLIQMAMTVELANLLGSSNGNVATWDELIIALENRNENIVVYGAITMEEDLVINNGLMFLRGGSITTDGHTLQINGPFQAGMYQVFYAAKNEVKFGRNASWAVWPELWGAKGDLINNDCDAVRCAIGGAWKRLALFNQYLIEPTDDSGDFMLYLGTNDGTDPRDGLEVFGFGPDTVIKLGDNVGRMPLLFGAGGTDELINITFKNFTVDCNGQNNLQTSYADPLRYNNAFYLSCYCQNVTFDQMAVKNVSGSQGIRVGNDDVSDVGDGIYFYNLKVHNFGIGIPGNLQQDCSAVYVEASNVVFTSPEFDNEPFPFDLARGHTAIELHGNVSVRLESPKYTQVQAPWLVTSSITDATQTIISNAIYNECNYMGIFDSASDGLEQSNFLAIGGSFKSSKVQSSCVLLGIANEGARLREQIMFADIEMDFTGCITQNCHVFRAEQVYLDSFVMADLWIKNALGCAFYGSGDTLPANTRQLGFVNNTLDSCGSTSGGYPGVPIVLHIDYTGTVDSLTVTGNTFLNSAGKNYDTAGLIRRDGDFNNLHIGANNYQLPAPFKQVLGTLGTCPNRYEEYFGSKTWDPASIPDGDYDDTAVTITGLVPGDQLTVGFSTPVPAGASLTASCTSTDTATVTLINHTGAPLDLASGTLRVNSESY